MPETLTVRVAGPADLSAIDGLLARSYPILLKPDYAPSTLVLALPLISRANPALVRSGSYYVVEEAGLVVGAGGWTRAASPGRATGTRRAVAHIRHVVTDHGRTRRGIGRALMARVLADAADSGATTVECLSTRTAVPFYRACGFADLGPVDHHARPGHRVPGRPDGAPPASVSVRRPCAAAR